MQAKNGWNARRYWGLDAALLTRAACGWDNCGDCRRANGTNWVADARRHNVGLVCSTEVVVWLYAT
jgi:hypothetical protein